MKAEEREIALYCLKANSNYHSEVCDECIKYPNCDHTTQTQDDITETIIKALEQHPILDKIRAEIKEVQTYKMFEGEDTVYVERKDVLAIIDKYKAESEVEE